MVFLEMRCCVRLLLILFPWLGMPFLALVSDLWRHNYSKCGKDWVKVSTHPPPPPLHISITPFPLFCVSVRYVPKGLCWGGSLRSKTTSNSLCVSLDAFSYIVRMLKTCTWKIPLHPPPLLGFGMLFTLNRWNTEQQTPQRKNSHGILSSLQRDLKKAASRPASQRITVKGCL